MVVLRVDTDSFRDASAQAHSSAQSVGRAISRAVSGFGGLSHMAGSDPNGLKWAASYDQACGQLLTYAAQLQDAVSSVSRKLAVTGYYYEVVELANAGAANVGLALPSPVVATSCPYIPSAAGGHRKFPSPVPGMEWVAEQIANLVGNMWPDGDTAQLDEASRVWHRLANDLDDVASTVSKVPQALAGVDTPELPRIEDEVDRVRTFAKKVASACRQLGTSCNALSGNIAHVHLQTGITVGVTIAAIGVTVAASLGLTVFTFGISDAVGVAGVAGETAGAVATIMGFIAELGASISAAVGGIAASTAGLVGISADLAATIGVTVGDITASAVLWGVAGAGENVLLTGITEPDTGDLVGAAEEGFVGGAIGGGMGAGLGKVIELGGGGGKLVETIEDDGRTLRVIRDSDNQDLVLSDGSAAAAADLLTIADEAAIGDYTGPGYINVNAGLRGQIPMTPELQARADAVSLALSKLPDAPGVAFRGAHLEIEQIDRYVPGSVVKEDAFTSSAADPAQAFAGNTKFFIDSFHGKDVKAWSSVESESEILFDKGTSFDVISKTYDSVSHTYFIGLREVP